jgi:hypothetical protein
MSTKTKIGVVSVLLLAGAAIVALQYQTHLKESARLDDQNREIERLNRQIVQLKQAAATSAHAAEVRAPAAAATSLAPGGQPSAKPPLAAGLTPTLSLKNAGRSTPRDAFETQLWAARHGDIATTASAITFGPVARARMEALVNQLPDTVRATYNTPELLMAFVLAGSPHPVGGMAVLGETPIDDNNVTLQTEWQHEDDTVVHQTNAHLQLTADGWKVVEPLVLVDLASAYLLRHPPE